MAQSKYTVDEQRDAIVWDLLNDARHATEQAENGPYFPDLNITRDTLLAYAEKCTAQAAGFGHGAKAINNFIAGKE